MSLSLCLNSLMSLIAKYSSWHQVTSSSADPRQQFSDRSSRDWCHILACSDYPGSCHWSHIDFWWMEIFTWKVMKASKVFILESGLVDYIPYFDLMFYPVGFNLYVIFSFLFLCFFPSVSPSWFSLVSLQLAFSQPSYTFHFSDLGFSVIGLVLVMQIQSI